MAVKRPPMKKLPSERIESPLDRIRRDAKGARKPEMISVIYEKYGFDDLVCLNLANNPATPSEVREKLAGHSNVEIRFKIATNSNLIHDMNVLKRLAFDRYEIRKQVARSTSLDSIKELLYKSNPQNIDIRRTCIKRLTNMDTVEKLVFSRDPEKTVPLYVDSIMSNRHLNKRIALLVLKYAEMLSDEQIDLIVELIQNDRDSAREMLDKTTKE